MKFTDEQVKAMLLPAPEKVTDRKVWSISVHGVVVPFFMATNVMGASHISHDALGAPLRLAYEKDGTPRFSKAGRPVLRVAKELSDQVAILRQNYIAGLIGFTSEVAKARAKDYKAQAELCHKAGEVIYTHDRVSLQAYLDSIKADTNGDTAGSGDTIAPQPEKELVPA